MQTQNVVSKELHTSQYGQTCTHKINYCIMLGLVLFAIAAKLIGHIGLSKKVNKT